MKVSTYSPDMMISGALTQIFGMLISLVSFEWSKLEMVLELYTVTKVYMF